MPRSDAEECVCGKMCKPVIYIGHERIAICATCHEMIAESDLEWSENITRRDLKARIIMLKNIERHDDVLRALARGGKKRAKRRTRKRHHT